MTLTLRVIAIMSRPFVAFGRGWMLILLKRSTGRTSVKGRDNDYFHAERGVILPRSSFILCLIDAWATHE